MKIVMKSILSFAFCLAAADSFAGACSGIVDGLREIQLAAGVSTGAGGAGILTGGAAVVAGVMKGNADR